MLLDVTDEHARKMAAEAVNSSKAVGLGWLHHQPDMEITSDDIHIVEGRISIDYFQGRMVKFHARKNPQDLWDFNPDEPTPDYQSWCLKYPTWQDLADATKPV